MPRLVEAHKKYSSSGKFTAFISNVQRNDDKSKAHYNKDAPGIPVYFQVRLPHAPCGRGIPYFVLFDHTGKIVKQGEPLGTMLAMIPDLVKATPDPVPPILGDVKIKLCKSDADALAKGRPIAPILTRLDKSAAKDDARGKEAKALAGAVREFMKKETERLVKLAESQPAAAAIGLEDLLKQSKGLPLEATLKEALDPLTKDSNVKALIKIIDDLENAREKLAKSSSNKDAMKKLSKAKSNLNKLAEKNGVSDLLKQEAKELHDSL